MYHAVVLCGGSGTRLWPLTRSAMPKQFLPLTSERSLLVETVERVDLGPIVREKVRYLVEPDDRVTAYLFVPPGPPRPGPAVLCLHQHAGQFHLGKSEPAGLAGHLQRSTAGAATRERDRGG